MAAERTAAAVLEVKEVRYFTLLLKLSQKF